MSTLANQLQKSNNALKASTGSREAQLDIALQERMETFVTLAGGQLAAEDFLRRIKVYATINPELLNCTFDSFVAAAIQTLISELEPNPLMGEVWFVPYKKNVKFQNEKGIWCERTEKHVQFQLGAKGYQALVENLPNILTINVQTVYEKDTFSYTLNKVITRDTAGHITIEDPINHIPADGDRGKPVKFYTEIFGIRDTTLFIKRKVYNKEDLISHGRKYSKTFDSGPWKSNVDEMCRKTALKLFCKEQRLTKSKVRDIMYSDSTVMQLAPTGNNNFIPVIAESDESVEPIQRIEAQPYEIPTQEVIQSPVEPPKIEQEATKNTEPEKVSNPNFKTQNTKCRQLMSVLGWDPIQYKKEFQAMFPTLESSTQATSEEMNKWISYLESLTNEENPIDEVPIDASDFEMQEEAVQNTKTEVVNTDVQKPETPAVVPADQTELQKRGLVVNRDFRSYNALISNTNDPEIIDLLEKEVATSRMVNANKNLLLATIAEKKSKQ